MEDIGLKDKGTVNRGMAYLLAKRPLRLRIASNALTGVDRLCFGADHSWRRRQLDGGRGISSGWLTPLWLRLERKELEFVNDWIEQYKRCSEIVVGKKGVTLR